MLRSLAARLQALVRRASAEADLDEEIRYHLERDAARYRSRGLDAHRARLAARRDFGSVDYVKESVRDGWGSRWLGELRQDLGFGLRVFRRAPSFALVVVLTISVGLGLTATAFTLFDSSVLRSVPVRDPHALYELGWIGVEGNRTDFRWDDTGP